MFRIQQGGKRCVWSKSVCRCSRCCCCCCLWWRRRNDAPGESTRSNEDRPAPECRLPMSCSSLPVGTRSSCALRTAFSARVKPATTFQGPLSPPSPTLFWPTDRLAWRIWPASNCTHPLLLLHLSPLATPPLFFPSRANMLPAFFRHADACCRYSPATPAELGARPISAANLPLNFAFA